MHLRQLVDGGFGLGEIGADDLIADVIAGEVLEDDDEVAAVVHGGQVDERTVGGTAGIELREVVDLACVDAVVLGDTAVDLVGGRELHDDTGRRLARVTARRSGR